jgi:P4 family phage/plasmid primase-like protien
MGEDRYSYLDGSGADGAVFYRDDGHLYSHHESDPASGNRNAFDLVRLHKFAELDEAVAAGTPIGDMPSQKAMKEFAKAQPLALAEWDDAPKEIVAEDEFEDVVTDAGETLVVDMISYASITADIEAVMAAEESMTLEEHNTLVLKTAASDVGDAELGAIAHKLKEAGALQGATKAEIKNSIVGKRAQLKKRADLESNDPQREMLDHFEKRFYNGGQDIRRHGKVYWKFTGTHWKTVSEEIINSGMISAVSDVLAAAEGKKETARLHAAFGDKETSTVWNNLRMMYQSIVAGRTAAAAKDEDDPMGLVRARLPAGINCNSGTIRFNKKGNFRQEPHRRDDLFTSVIPVDFNKDAECPVWDKFCADTFQNAKEPKELQRHLEEICGYIINMSRRQRCWVMLYGPTRSGKSTVGALLKTMMGPTCKTMPMEHYSGGNSHASTGLIGKQCLLEDDLAAKTLLNDSFIKTNSDEKHMGFNPKGGEEGEFVSRAVIVICSNNPPRTRDVSGALAERALVLPFDHTVSLAERDEYLGDKLEAEMPGIFTRFVRRFAALNARGGWDYPLDATLAWAKWQKKSNSVLQFLGDCYEEHEGEFLLRADLWHSYDKWVGLQKIKNPLEKSGFLEAVDQQWGEPRRRSNGWGWAGRKFIQGCMDYRTEEERVNDDEEFDDLEVKWDV